MYQDEVAYRIYVTDELFYSGHNKTHADKFSELWNYVESTEDTRSGDEIARDVIKNAGLVVE